jgi:hypothetical protein
MKNVSPATSITVVWLHQAAECKGWQNEHFKDLIFALNRLYSSRQKEIQ